MKDGLPVELFENEIDWANWLENNINSPGVWVRIAKKNSGVTSITYQQAVDVGICYGWIDGLKQKFDEKTFAQRFTPRKPKSNWSKINKEKAERFIREGKMTAAGMASIDRAKESGAWDNAYDSQKNIQVPDDFQKALVSNKKALDFFETLDSVNRYSVLYRIQVTRSQKSRVLKIKELVEMLENNLKFHN